VHPAGAARHLLLRDADRTRQRRQIRVIGGIVTILLAVALVFNLPAVLQRAIPDYTSSLQEKVGGEEQPEGSKDLPPVVEAQDTTPTEQLTPETYFGAGKVVNYRGVGDYDEGTRIYALPAQLPDDSFAMRGTWAVDYQGVTAQSDDNAIALNYHARNAYIVVGGTGTMTVTNDGKTTIIPVSGSPNMRQLVTDDQDGAGSLQVSLSKGLQAFSFTYG
jgi:hypothetical protein